MDKVNLTQFYDDLKSELSSDRSTVDPSLMNVGGQGATAWRTQASKESEKLKDECYKHILLDMYCKIIPLDSDYIAGNQGQMKSDVDSLLANKGMTATQYLTSAYEKTHAPLLEFILRSGTNIGKQFIKESEETLKDAQKNNLSVPAPSADKDSKEVQDQIVEIEKDTEYSTFIDKLKEKTINKIVADVSKIISDKKEESNMTFNPKTDGDTALESTMTVVMDYLNQKMWKENLEVSPVLQEEMIGLAIRESTLNQLDIVFKQPDSDIRPFTTKIRLGKGVLINESAVSYLIETAKEEIKEAAESTTEWQKKFKVEEAAYMKEYGSKLKEVVNYLDKIVVKTIQSNDELKDLDKKDYIKEIKSEGVINTPMYIGRGEFIVYSGLQIYDEIPNDINKNNELVAKLFSFMLKELKSSKLEVLKEFDIPTESGGWLDKMDSIPGITIICKKKITEDK